MSPGGLPRAPALVPLSRDHHDALVEVLFLRRAQGRPAAGRRFVDFFHSEVEGHMADEEDVVLPAVEGSDPGGRRRASGGSTPSCGAWWPSSAAGSIPGGTRRT